MNKKIVISLSVIAAAAAVVIGGTSAFFSDTETSTGNTFTAGAIDLKVSSKHTDYTGVQGGFSAQDLNGSPLFSFADMKPGDVGGGNFDVIATSNDYWACMRATVDTKPENGVVEPETAASDSTANGSQDGELQNHLSFYLWNDLDNDGQFTPNDITKDRNLVGPMSLATLQAAGYLPLADTTSASFFSSSALAPNVPKYLGYKFCFGDWGTSSATTGLSCSGAGNQNDSQTDGVTGTIDFYAVQSRNNTGFTCASMNPVQSTRVSSGLMQFGPNGWGGWSCPAGKHAVSGGYEPSPSGNPVTSSQIAGSNSVWSHHTFGANESGWVVQNGNTGQALSVYVDCVPTI